MPDSTVRWGPAGGCERALASGSPLRAETIFCGFGVPARVRSGRAKGRGMATGPVVDPEAVARKVAAMSLGRREAREVRLQDEAKLLSEVTALGLEELRRRSTMRQ